MSLEREDVDRAAAILVEARKATRREAMPAVDFAEPLLDALIRLGHTSVATPLRARLGATTA